MRAIKTLAAPRRTENRRLVGIDAGLVTRHLVCRARRPVRFTGSGRVLRLGEVRAFIA